MAPCDSKKYWCLFCSLCTPPLHRSCCTYWAPSWGGFSQQDHLSSVPSAAPVARITSTLGPIRLICQKGLSSRAYKDHLSHIRMLSGYRCICHVTFRFHRVQPGHKVIKLTEIQIICAFCTCQTSPIKSLSAGMRSSIPRSLLRHPQMLNSSLQWGMVNDHDRQQLSLGLFGTYFDSVQVLTDWRGLHCLWKNKWF